MRFAWIAVLALVACGRAPQPEQPWARHSIDNSSSGADGVRAADVNGDGLVDFPTGWEEGGLVRAYLNPGPAKAGEPWPAVTVGEVDAPEDAVFTDLDGDGAWDVVSSTEGNNNALYIHWAHSEPQRYLDPEAWTTMEMPASRNLTRWMFALPMDVDGRNGIDIFAGSKNDPAYIGWWESPRDPRQLEDWVWHPVYDAGWIMSLIAHDVDGDGDQDVVASDRKGPNRGLLWLENPSWQEHRVGPVDMDEAMFMTVADLDQDGLDDFVSAVKDGPILFYRRLPGDEIDWERYEIPLPEGTGTGKAAAVADFDLDGDMDIAFTCENANDGKTGAMWLSAEGPPTGGRWTAHPISGQGGVKFDRIELADLDADGDLDLVTCEERDDYGVIWYENPTR